jgi:hypothetical protein
MLHALVISAVCIGGFLVGVRIQEWREKREAKKARVYVKGYCPCCGATWEAREKLPCPNPDCTGQDPEVPSEGR